MTAGMDVHTRQEMEGEQRAMTAMQPIREAASIELANRPGYDVASLTDQQFEQGLERIKARQLRMQRILDTVLVKEVHYGNPNNSFKKPMLFQAGAEELRTFFRLTPRHMEPPTIVATKEFASVTVTVGLYDNGGRLCAVRSGNCNTMEKRFQKRDGKSWTYTDAREVVHNCLAMAEKRALKFATSEATGATAFFSNEDEMEAALDEGKPEPVAWTAEEKAAVYAAAKAAGMKTDDLALLIEQTLGGMFVETGDPAARLLAAVKAWKKPGTKPVPMDGYGSEERKGE